MEKLGIFGGSFNPVHKGHIYLLKSLKEKLGLSKVLVMPSSVPPHKDILEKVPDEKRIDMLKKALEGIEGVEISLFEIENGGKSYTYFTLEEMKRLYPESEIYFLVGSDMFLSLDSWFNYPKIMDMAVFCAIPREKENRTLLKEKQKYFESLGYKTEVLDIEPLDISSSLIREKIKKGEKIDGLLPKSVEEYIRNNKLYV